MRVKGDGDLISLAALDSFSVRGEAMRTARPRFRTAPTLAVGATLAVVHFLSPRCSSDPRGRLKRGKRIATPVTSVTGSQ